MRSRLPDRRSLAIRAARFLSVLAAMSIVLSSVMLLAPTAHAGQPGEIRIEQPIPGLPTGQEGGITFAVATFQTYLRAAAQFAVLIIIITAAVYIAIGAYAYFIAAGNAAMAAKGKEIIQRSIIGLLIALVAYVILRTISPQFVELQPPELADRGRGGGPANVPRPGGGGPGGGPGGGMPGGNAGGGMPGGAGQNQPGQPGPAVQGNVAFVRVLTAEEWARLQQQNPNIAPNQIFIFADQPNAPLSSDQVVDRITELHRQGLLTTTIHQGGNRQANVIIDVPDASLPPDPNIIVFPISPEFNRILYNPQRFPIPSPVALEQLQSSLRSSGWSAPIFPRPIIRR